MTFTSRFFVVTFALGSLAAGCGTPSSPLTGDMTVNTCSFCQPPGQCCGTKCVNTMSDFANCGGCGKTCNGTCSNGMCNTGGSCTNCPASCCNNLCVDFKTDRSNCGRCGNACTGAQQCQNGNCSGGGSCTNCSQTCCNQTQCVDTTSDNNNCGGCNLSCLSSQVCMNSQCINAGGNPDGGAGCTCTKTCILGCLGGCCAEDVLFGSCSPDPNCVGLGD